MEIKKTALALLATGGTIAGSNEDNVLGSYTSGNIKIEDLLKRIKVYSNDIVIQTHTISNIGSQDINEDIWQKIVSSLLSIAKNPDIKAIVITHGTDTIEETAFLLHLTVNINKPIILVGAMRPIDAIGTDGTRSLLNAIKIATSDDIQYGTLIVSGDSIFDPITSYKVTTSGTEGLSSHPSGPIGCVSPSTLRIFINNYQIQDSTRGSFTLPQTGYWPRVAIIYISANLDKESTLAIINSCPHGIILAGVGHGNAPLWLLDHLTSVIKNTQIKVVRSTRINRGTVIYNLEVDDHNRGFISGNSLNPQRCRILLQLLLHKNIHDTSKIQSIFDKF